MRRAANPRRDWAYSNVKIIVTFMQPVMDRLYRIAEAQAGYVTTAQAAEVGVSRQELYYLRRTGELRHVAYGIQRLARFPSSPHEDIVVACLWAGVEAVASHETALVVYGIGEAMPATIHITTPNSFRGRRAGVRVHHDPIDPDERAHFDGVPVTSLIRTIADVARQNTSDARAALRDALDQGLIRRGQLHMAAVRYPHAQAVLGATS
jgi:predicted transcriptional regulator of viral defense system